MRLKAHILFHFAISMMLYSIGLAQDNSGLLFNHRFEEKTFDQPFDGNEFDYFVSIEETMDRLRADQLENDFEEFLGRVSHKQSKYKSDRAFLKYLFYKVHNKILKRYTSHAMVSSTISEGKYDCVTGSAIYALILNHLGYEFQVRELDYHIFLEIRTQEGLVVLESTDPVYGFYSSSADISNLMEQFNSTTDESSYDFVNESNNRVGLKELAGLQYYNRAIQLYNNHEFDKALTAINKAHSLYQSTRVKEIRNLISAFADGQTVALAQDD